jgi:hypothetical protein
MRRCAYKSDITWSKEWVIEKENGNEDFARLFLKHAHNISL